MQKNERYMTDNFPKMNFVGLAGILVQFSQEICESGNAAALAFRQEIEKKKSPLYNRKLQLIASRIFQNRYKNSSSRFSP